jgi:GNAT superfamily N-acetyltransferase
MTKPFKLSALKFHAATPSRWGDIERLFGERGACGGCWCMNFRLSASDYQKGKGAGNKRALRRIVKSGEKPGIIAYHEGQPIGWCAIAPRERYPRLAKSRVLRPVDDQPVWSVTCLFILKPCRRKGVSARLLRAAADFAARRGARIVEGYPIVSTMEKTPDPFLWRGVPSAFQRAGFKEVARRSRTSPIMRRRVRRSGV